MDSLTHPNNGTEFVLLGHTQNPHLQKVLFIVFLFIFLFTELSNLLPQPHTFCSHVLFSQSLVLNRCIFHLCHHPQNDPRPAALEENHLLDWLPDSALYGALPGSVRDHRSHCHVLWPLRGHLQASALHDHHATGALPAPGGGGLDWGDPTCPGPDSLYSQLDLLWSQCHWPLHVWFLLTVGTCLQRHLQAWNCGGH